MPARGRFTVTIAGATDTAVTGGVGAWTDEIGSDGTSVDHALDAWSDAPARVVAIRMSMRRGADAPALAAGATFRRGEGSLLNAGLYLSCAPLSIGSGACTGELGARQDTPVVLSLSRVERDTIAGVLEFGATGWLSGQWTGAPPPDTVTVRMEFVMPRQKS